MHDLLRMAINLTFKIQFLEILECSNLIDSKSFIGKNNLKTFDNIN